MPEPVRGPASGAEKRVRSECEAQVVSRSVFNAMSPSSLRHKREVVFVGRVRAMEVVALHPTAPAHQCSGLKRNSDTHRPTV